MKRSITALLALLLASASAGAAKQEARGFYIGGIAGTSALEDDGIFDGFDFDDSGTSYGIAGGYKFFRYLAVEGRLLSLGSFSADGEEFDAAGLSAHVVGIIPFGQSGWELFGQLGIGAVGLDSDCCGSDSGAAGSAGIGLRFYPTPHLGISVQADAYAWQEEDFYDTYDVGVRTVQLGVHYLF
jgi:hypothetical protein